MNTHDLLVAWGRILTGKLPLLSIEITRECPLHCPGCYAYGDSHLGGDLNLREVADFRGKELIDGIMGIVRRYQPMHVSLVGGEPMMRHRELSEILPRLSKMGIWTMVVTSGVIPIPKDWCELPNTTIAVSVDGLPAEHDVRRTPATYERILKNIGGRKVNIHLTATQQMMTRVGYLDDYFDFWNSRPEVHQIWLSLYSPQKGEDSPERLLPESRRRIAENIPAWQRKYPKLLADSRFVRAYIAPPKNPADCTFARMSVNFTADLTTRVEPCIFGGDPDCSQCGCAISAALHGIQDLKIKGPLKVGHLVRSSIKIGDLTNSLRPNVGRAERWRKSNAPLVQIAVHSESQTMAKAHKRSA
jgi:MoaA/NifB/PqqE/SkfB family radical SAM enzyme